MSTKDTLKRIVKGVAPKSTFGTDPKDPWSVKSGINESADLEKYLLSRGINPNSLSVQSKISHSKSMEFLRWKQQHESVSHEIHNEAKKKMSALDKFRQASYEREKARKEFQKSIAHLPQDDRIKASLDRLAKSVNKEEVEQIDELKKSTVKSYLQKKTNKPGVPSQKDVTGMANATVRLMGRKPTSEEVELDEADRGGFTASWRNAKYFGKGVPTNRPMTDKEKAEHEKMKQMQKSLDDMGKNLFKKEDMGHMATKGETGGTAQRKSEYEKAKAAYKEIKTPHGPGHHKEDVGDAKAAVNADGLNTQQQTMQAERSKSARIIKAIYKKKKMVKEDMYDHEKEDKSVKTYGKKPKFDKTDPKESVGEKKPQAAATLSGGKTLTGTDRDTVEIDPVMRNRPGQPDVNKKEDKKDDKKKDK